MDNSTIAAIATPGGRGGIGIIKISGSQAISIAGSIFRPHDSSYACGHNHSPESNENDNGHFQSHHLNYGRIIDPENERVLDEVLVSVMKAPHTYTKEDVVEINAHGGAVALQAILALVLRRGARLAEPGEFTKRAFLNGRIDLTQAEAVIDIVNARTEKSLQIATAQIDGQLRKQVESIRERLIQFLAHAEAAIDFPEDVDDIFDTHKAAIEVDKEVIDPLKRLIRNYMEAGVLRDGLKVAVVGKPNAGKSSLMNRLVQRDRAIVTSIPGTTRDVIEETLNIKGLPVIISDTAGLHETDDPVETLGIEKTLEHVNGSDLVLFLIEAHRPLTDVDYQIYEKVKSKPLIIAINKIDLVNQNSDAVLPEPWAKYEKVYTSALYGQGMDSLKEHIVKLTTGENPIDLDTIIVPNLRHKVTLERSLKAAEEMVVEMQNGTSTDLIAIHIQDAIDSLDEILGINLKVDVLDQIFRQFCIGK
ncbi:MAG: tRNA uridine-5-carboxymethylaminomethyl(34) synthesis GTPase MnmE [Desulfobacterales bacterium]|nr:MAG: tRNA uridine-5-carboxymethylaminomethyl(34) synthesis GTPase MnmE [Desulfobacterales bacterium]